MRRRTDPSWDGVLTGGMTGHTHEKRHVLVANDLREPDIGDRLPVAVPLIARVLEHDPLDCEAFGKRGVEARGRESRSSPCRSLQDLNCLVAQPGEAADDLLPEGCFV